MIHAFRTSAHGFTAGLPKGLKELLGKPVYFLYGEAEILDKSACEGYDEKESLRAAEINAIRGKEYEPRE